SLTRFTLIYPSCSVLLFGNDRANWGVWTTKVAFPKNSCVETWWSLCANGHKSHKVVHLPYKPYSTSERISLALWKRFEKLVDFSGGVIEMRGDTQAITAWCCDDILRVELVIENHR